ncbi:aspartyl protease family protein 2-like [Telopea speciosissima]|uniref:aspartyl protease family protein 2-like n=1 Tax=Telopea speciosissima TaxID=54955 RepID=UPI001CC52C67|nr:aspartyl protease family protein 2-like [Telopea speciosissima]
MVRGFSNSPSMEGKVKAIIFSLFLQVICLSGGSAKPLQYQNLVLGTLPGPPTHNRDLSWTESSILSQLETAETSIETTLTVRLEHRDALAFNATPEALFQLRLERDVTRVETLSTMAAGSRNATRVHSKNSSFSSSIISGLSQGSGEYFTRLGIGTPPKYLYMVLDTGSDIVWIQCAPCRKCYTQSDPIFDPKKSGSFAVVPCSSPLCRRLDMSGCSQQRLCLYQVSYGDGSFTVGDFSTETLTFRGTKVGNVALGCGHDNEGLFVGAAGLLGLGRGRMSFPSQTGRRFGRKFSYCLVDRQSSGSKLSSAVFGESSVPRSAVFTPLLTNPKLDTFYYIELTGISVGGVPVPGITASMFRLDATGNGGVIIDSGTSVTRLTRPAYIALRDAFLAGAQLKRAPGFSMFDTCYDLSGKSVVKVPTVVIHFGGGANLALPAANYLIPVDTNGTFCFAFAGTTSGLSIIGNIQQQGFRVVFDGAGSRIGFSPNGCA